MADGETLDSLSFEEALKKLEEIVHRLEGGDVPLDEAISLYAQGEELRKQCTSRLADAEARIDKIVAGPGGAPPVLQPFDPD
jgi:exodeoxyribonuclease VII small subunit